MAKAQETTNENQPAKSETQISGFVGATKAELTKVVWPSKQQLLSESVSVVLMVILVALVIYLVDNFFHWVAGKIF